MRPDLSGAELAELRALFLLDPAVTHLDTGTLGSAPRPVLAALGAADADYARCPRDPYEETALAETRAALARGLGCAADELAVVAGGTDAMARVLAGLDLGPGDEVLTTTHECFTVRAPLAQLADRRGVTVTRVAPPVGPDQTAEEVVRTFAAAVTPRTRVLQWAAVTTTAGAAFPTRALARLGHRHGLVTVVDGSQWIGQFDVDLHASGVDFVAASGSKYQCGPLGTGLLYARNRVLPEHNPLPLPEFWPVVSLGYPVDGPLPPRTTGREPAYDLGALLQQSDTADLSRARALGVAGELWDRVGRDRIERHVLGLAAHLRGRVVDRWGAGALVGPLADRRLLSGAVAFQPLAGPAAADPARLVELRNRLAREHRVTTQLTAVPVRDGGQRYAVRLTPHVYVDRDDLDRAVEAVAVVAAGLG